VVERSVALFLMMVTPRATRDFFSVAPKRVVAIFQVQQGKAKK